MVSGQLTEAWRPALRDPGAAHFPQLDWSDGNQFAPVFSICTSTRKRSSDSSREDSSCAVTMEPASLAYSHCNCHFFSTETFDPSASNRTESPRNESNGTS